MSCKELIGTEKEPNLVSAKGEGLMFFEFVPMVLISANIFGEQTF
jgi:hypothetical protein